MLLLGAFASACSPWGANIRARDPRRQWSPTRRPATSCRETSRTAISRIARAPYLQDFGEGYARVVWTSEAREGERLVFYRSDALEERRATVREDSLGEGLSRRVATLTGLEPGESYCYEVVSSGGETLYGPVGFRAKPPRGAPVDILLFGDSGGGTPEQHRLRDVMRRTPHDVILHAGDLAYFEATRSALDERFFAVYEQMLCTVPVYPVLGEHDRRVQLGAPWREAFVLPDDGAARGHYSFDFGLVHVAAIDTMGDLDAQAAWLDADLAATDATWRLVIGHRPPYSAGWHGGDDAVREAIVPVLARRGVDLYLSGHDHDYERSVPLDGVTYLVSGGGGHSTRFVGSNDHTARSESVIHFVHLRAGPDELRATAVDATGAVFDELSLRPRRRE